MNKRFLLVFVFIMLMVSTVSAMKIDDWKTYDKEKNEISITNAFGMGEKLATYKLTYNTDQSLINGEARGKAHLFVDSQLFSSMEFKDIDGDAVDLPYKVLYLNKIVWETEHDVFKEVCSEGKNGTTCVQNVIGTEIKERTREEWVEYDGEVLEEGVYEWKVLAKKDKDSDIDWIVSIDGGITGKIKFKEWAWWDGDWDYKKQIDITNADATTYNNYSMVLNVSYESSMESDFGDLRFTDSTESVELDYWIDPERLQDGVEAIIYVRLPVFTLSTDTVVFMYYGKSGASTTSDMGNAFVVGDDFNTGGLDARWFTVNNIVASQTNGVLNMSFISVAQNYGVIFNRNITEYNNYTVFTRTRLVGNTDTGGVFLRNHNGGCAGYVTAEIQDSANLIRTVKWNNLGASCGGESQSTLQTASWTQAQPAWHNITAEIIGISIKGRGDNPTAGTAANDGEFTLGGMVGYRGNVNANSWFEADYIYVVGNLTTFPTVTFGAEEINNALTITINSPIDGFNSSSNSVSFNCSSTDETGVMNITLEIDGVDNITQTGGAGQNISYFQTISIADGTYVWNCRAEDVELAIRGTNRTINIDGTNPVINITFPTDGSTITDAVSNPAGATVFINWTTSDTNLDTCWYNNQTTNITVTCGANATFSLSYGTYTHRVYANDTFGGFNTDSSTATYNALILLNSQTFSAATVSGILEDFSANITLDPSKEIVSATLVYNENSTTAGSITSSGQKRIISVDDFQIPLIPAAANLTFYWSLVLTDTSIVNLTSQIQEVLVISLDNCSVNNNTLFNISLFDEEFKTPLLGTIELLFQVQNKPLYNTMQNLSTIISNISTTTICSNINFSENDLAYSLEIRYYATDYATEFYNIQKADVLNQVTNISLFDLSLNDSTEFLIEYQNSEVIKVEGAIVQLLRKYISEDVYEVVEAPLTGNGGTTVVHVDLNTNKYRAVVIKDGVVLDTFDNIVFKCENELSGQCKHNLFAQINPQNSVSIEQLQDFAYSISETNGTVTTIFAVPSGTPSTVNIQLSQVDQFGNETLCNKTIISSGGSVDCTYSTTIGESYIKLNILKNGETQALKTYIIPESGGRDLLGNNFFIVFIFLLSIIGMAFSSPEWIIMNSVMTMLIAGSLWLLNGLNFVMGLGGLMWLVVAAAILIMKITKQEDK